MSSNLGIGVPVPKLLPITGTFALPFTAYFSLLAHRVVFNRLDTKKWIGDRSGDPSSTDRNELLVSGRAHSNFIENVPLAFVVGAVAELNGANRKILAYLYGALFVARVLHAELGLKSDESMGTGRPIGFWATQGFVVGVGAWATYLVKGYWGF